MTLRVKIVVLLVIGGAMASLWSIAGRPAQQWHHFFVYLLALLLSSGLKVALPRSEGTMSVDFPLIFLAMVQLSPMQAVGLAAFSVIAQCRIRVIKGFTLVQVLFNVTNVVTATTLAYDSYVAVLPFVHGEVAPALAVAATTYFFANTVPVTLVIAWDSGASLLAHWRLNYTWYLPFYLIGAMLAASAYLIEIHFGWMTSVLLIPAVYTVHRAYSAQMAIVRDRERHVVEIEALQLRTIEGLAMAIEATDQNTHQHLMRVRVYVSELGTLMALDEPLLKALHIAAFLHDIGKLAIPQHIINKPGKLTQEEFEKMKIHPVVGADILERVQFPFPVVPIVRGHHEAWDGSGYPDGLKGEDIPIGARILSAVDCFDALASERPYRKAMPLHEAMAILKRQAGSQFDPEVVALLEKHHQRLEAMARERLEDVAPLNTDLNITRGAAPGAGFAPEHEAKGSSETLNLIAAASQEAQTLSELSQLLGSSLSAQETNCTTSRHLQRLVPFDCFAVYLTSDEAVAPRYLDGPAAAGFSPTPIPIGHGVSGWVAESGLSILNGNPTVEPNYLEASELFTSQSSALSVPMITVTGNTFGALTVYARKAAAFSKDHLRILEAIQPNFSLALENALRYRTAEADRIDHLTELWNARYFIEQFDAEIERARTARECYAVMICNLNCFKAVNDSHGQLTGDALLRSIAQNFKICCRPADMIARMGGDGFAFVFRSMDRTATDGKRAHLQEAVLQACATLEIKPLISASIGIAFYPADGETSVDLLGLADREMYRHKREFYSSQGSHNVEPAVEGLMA